MKKKDLTIKSNREFLKKSKLTGFRKTEKIIYEYLLAIVNDKASKLKKITDKDIEDLKVCYFRIGDIISEYSKYSKKKLNYSRLMDYCDNLTNKQVKINGNIKNQTFRGKFNIFEGDLIIYPEDDVKAGTIEIHFTDVFLKNYIRIQDLNGWQKYSWGRIVQVDNDKGIDFYKFFKAHEWEAIHNSDRTYAKTFTLEDLYKMCLDTDRKGNFLNKKYIENVDFFEERVLDPMCESVNNSDLKLFKFDYFIKKGKRKGEKIEKCYEKSKKGYRFVCDYTNSDYFKYHQNKNIIENKKALQYNQYRYDSNHRKIKTKSKKSSYQRSAEELFKNVEEINLENVNTNLHNTRELDRNENYDKLFYDSISNGKFK